MALTPTQVQQIINQQTAPGTPTPDTSIPDLPPDWNPIPQTQQQTTTGGAPPYFLTPPGGTYDPTTQPANLFGGDLGILDPSRYQVIAPTKYHGWLIFDKFTGGYRAPSADELAQIAGSAGGGATGTTADHYGTDVQAASEAAALAEKQREFGLTFPEQQRQFDLQQQLATQTQQAGVLQNRAQTGTELGTLQRGLAQDAYQRALDPGNFPAYLAASAGLPRSGASPIDQLLGQGTQIAQPEGGNPLADPRFQALQNELYGYARPQAVSTVQGIAAANGGTLPQAFYDYTGTQAPAHATGGTQLLHGPVVGIPEAQLMPGQAPQFLAGEAGPEQLKFTPETLHAHASGGVPIPHSHARGHEKHEHMDANSPPAFAEGGTADVSPTTGASLPAHSLLPTGENTGQNPTPAAPPGGVYNYDQPDPNLQRVRDAYARDPAAAQTFFSQPPENLQRMFGSQPTTNPSDFFKAWPTYTPEQQQRLRGIAQAGGISPAMGTNIALGKGLQQLGYVPNTLVQRLLTGESPTPGMIDDATLMRLPPSYRALLQAAIRAQVGSAGLGDYAASQQEYALPGLGSSYPSVSYG